MLGSFWRITQATNDRFPLKLGKPLGVSPAQVRTRAKAGAPVWARRVSPAITIMARILIESNRKRGNCFPPLRTAESPPSPCLERVKFRTRSMAQCDEPEYERYSAHEQCISKPTVRDALSPFACSTALDHGRLVNVRDSPTANPWNFAKTRG